MQNIRISKIKARRGTDTQRKLVTFDQGELVYTTDTQRLFAGTGNTLGGLTIGAKIHPLLLNYYSLSTLNAQIGDLVNVNNIFYQLTAQPYSNITSWANVGAKIDSTFFNYNSNNNITLKVGSISSIYLNPSTISNGLTVNSGILQIDLNTNSLEISANKLSVKQSGITEREISSTTITTGLTGGSGSKIRLNVDPTTFYFVNNTLTLSSKLPLAFSSLSSGWFGNGLEYDSVNSKINVTVNNSLSVIGDNIGLSPNIAGSGIGYNTTTFKLSSYITSIDNTLTRNSVGLLGIAPTLFSAGLVFSSFYGTLSTTLIDVDSATISKSNGIISLNPSIFGDGLVYDTGTDTLSTNLVGVESPLTNTNGVIGIDPSTFGDGLVYDTSTYVLSTNITGVDNITITKTDAGVISIPEISLAGSTLNWPRITIDTYGRVTNMESSIYDTLTGNCTLSSFNSSSTLSALFNGTPNHTLSGAIPGLELMNFTATASDGSTVTLSSAGFIVFNGSHTSRTGQTIGRFAIPIFAY